MDFGYDEFGNRTSAAGRGGGGSDDGSRQDEDAQVHSAHDSDNGVTPQQYGAEDDDNEESAGPRQRDRSNSDSDFSDDVELIIGEEGNQALNQPLVDQSEVQPSAYGRRGAAERREAGFLLENRRAGQGGPSSSLMMIESSSGAPAAAPTAAQQTYMDVLASLPDRMRNVALVGSMHHGKTAIAEILLSGKPYHKRADEADREMTLKSHVLTTVAGGATLQKTSRQLTLIDTPGHPDFTGEAAAGMRLADAILFCVDAAESLSDHGEHLLRHAVVREQLPVVLVLTKVDRLMVDLKLPPLDAYRKLRMVVDTVNNVIASCGTTYDSFLVSPERGTVCFASARLGFFFSLETFALKYAAVYPSLNAAALATKLWGQITYDKKAFKKITNFRQRPSFVQFILEPLYKIVSHAVSGTGAETLSSALTKLPRSPLSAMQEAVRHFCGAPTGDSLDALLSVLPTATGRSQWLTEHYGAAVAVAAAGSSSSTAAAAASSRGGDDVVVAVASLQRVFDVKNTLAAVVRVTHGTLVANAGPNKAAGGGGGGSAAPSRAAPGRPRLIAFDEFSSDADPYYEVTVQQLFLRTAEDGFVPVSRATAGQVVYVTGLPPRAGAHLVLVGGRPAAALLAEDEGTPLPASAATTADNHEEEQEGPAAFSSDWVETVKVYPLGVSPPLLHVAVEVRDPAKAARVQDGLNVLLRTSPGLDVHKEETGEYTLSGYGELQLDTALHELRHGLCSGVPVGISQPFVTFSETVHDAEGLLAMAGGRSCSIGFVSGVLPRSFTHALEYEQLDLFPGAGGGGDDDEADTASGNGHGGGGGRLKRLWTVLRRDHGFDALDARHILAAGPDATKGPSILVDDTLPEETHHALKPAHHHAVVSAFRSTMASGPLIGGVVRGVAAKLTFADAEATMRDAVVLSHARTALRHSLFGARPRLMEPVLAAEILCAPECVPQLSEILLQRRGAMLGEELIAATTLVRARALVPAMDSFGLETQIRMLTHGQAFPLFRFHQWDVVPGDPFDASIHVGPLEPARGYQLARDFVLKTRFRKGLPQNMLSDL